MEALPRQGSDCDFQHHVIGDARQYQIVLGRRQQHAVFHHEDVAGRGFGELAVAELSKHVFAGMRHRAEALQWMFFEQHSLEPNIGAAYFWLNLIKGGHDVTVWARRAESMQPLLEAGAQGAANPTEVAKVCDVVISMVAWVINR